MEFVFEQPGQTVMKFHAESLSWDSSSLADINIQRRQTDRLVSLASEGLVDKSVMLFKDVIPLAVSRLTAMRNTLNTFTNAVMAIPAAIVKFRNGILLRNLREDSYLHFHKLLVPVPTGFEGNIAAYGEVIIEVAQRVHNAAPRYLQEYRGFVAAFISDKSTKLAMKDHTKFYTSVEAELESNRDRFAQFVSTKNQMRQLNEFGKVCKSIAQYKDLAKIRDTVSRSYDTKHHVAIGSELNKTVEILNVLLDLINENGIKDISPQAAASLAAGARAMAELVEFVAVLRFHEEQFMTAVDKIDEALAAQIS